MVQFFAIHVCGPEPAALFVPVQFQELGRTRTAKGDRLPTGRLVALKRVHDFHAENLGVQVQGALDIPDPEPCVYKAERHGTGSREGDLNNLGTTGSARTRRGETPTLSYPCQPSLTIVKLSVLSRSGVFSTTENSPPATNGPVVIGSRSRASPTDRSPRACRSRIDMDPSRMGRSPSSSPRRISRGDCGPGRRQRRARGRGRRAPSAEDRRRDTRRGGSPPGRRLPRTRPGSRS